MRIDDERLWATASRPRLQIPIALTGCSLCGTECIAVIRIEVAHVVPDMWEREASKEQTGGSALFYLSTCLFLLATHHDESTNVSRVSVSRIAVPPHWGQDTSSHSLLAVLRGAVSVPLRFTVDSFNWEEERRRMSQFYQSTVSR